jgi:Bacterial capsule synthesis protein PGA_cap
MILWQSHRATEIAARIAVVGDFLPAWKCAEKRPRLESSASWKEMAAGLANDFAGINISFVNLECTLNTAGLEPRQLDGLGDIVSAPDVCLEWLSSIRAGVIGIANNHAYDFGLQGIERTRAAIAARGLAPLGAGHRLETPPEVFVWNGPNDVRIGFWAAARAAAHLSTRTRAGIEPAGLRRAQQALQAIRSEGAGFCVALLHAGCLRTSYPSSEDLQLIDAIAHAGFDIVAASHSHRISGAKIVHRTNNRPAFCFYGLGSIVSGFIGSPPEREGLIVVAAFDSRGELVRIEIRPVLLDQNGFGAIPSPAECDALLKRFRELSAHITDGSYTHRFHSEISPGLVRLYIRDARKAFEQGGLQGIARKARRIRMRHVRRLVHSVLP